MIAHREFFVPFSCLDGNKKPVGYALDLCTRLAESVRKKLGAKGEDGIKLVMVTPANRIAMIAEGKAEAFVHLPPSDLLRDFWQYPTDVAPF